MLTEKSEDVSLQGQKEHYDRDTGKDKCTMPCEMTAKLMRDEKHSLCSKCLNFCAYSVIYFNNLHV